MDSAVYKMMKDWADLIEKQNLELELKLKERARKIKKIIKKI